jgi:adenine phosphoribosyltransferase
VPFKSEYIGGHLYLNGIEAGDQIILVDDTISTGGTMIALINGVRELGAEVVEVLALIEKPDNHGVERVLEATGLEVKTYMKIRIVLTDDGYKVKIVEKESPKWI